MEKEIQNGFLRLKSSQQKSYDGIKRVLLEVKRELEDYQNLSSNEENSSFLSLKEENLKKLIKEKNEIITEHLKNYHTQISKYIKVLEKVLFLSFLLALFATHSHFHSLTISDLLLESFFLLSFF